jgi:hypothetical protein
MTVKTTAQCETLIDVISVPLTAQLVHQDPTALAVVLVILSFRQDQRVKSYYIFGVDSAKHNIEVVRQKSSAQSPTKASHAEQLLFQDFLQVDT